MRRLLPISLFIIGLGCLGLGLYSYLKPITPVQAVEPTIPLPIPMLSWRTAEFDIQRPQYEGQNGGYPEQLYMRKVGFITYTIPIGERSLRGHPVQISVTLSSELPAQTSTDKLLSSDVTLVVNEVEQSTQNVIPDDVHGRVYTWSVPVRVFRINQNNDITFRVKPESSYKNGLCIYSPIALQFE